MATKGGYPLRTVSRKQRVYSGHFAGINGESPTTYVLDDGVTVTRTGEGVWDIEFPAPLAGFKACLVQAHDNGGAVHDVNNVVRSVADRKITVTHRTATYAAASTHTPTPVVVRGSNITDVAAADAATTNRSYAVAPVAGTVTKCTAQVVSGGALDADAIITTNINGTPITTGAITLPNTSAAGTAVSVTPTGANTVAVGDVLTGVTNAGGSTTAAAALQYVIQPAAAAGVAAQDVVDEIHFVVTVELSDIPGAGL